MIIYDGYNDSFNLQLDDIEQSDLNPKKHNVLFEFIKTHLNTFATPKLIYQKTKDIFVANSLNDEIVKQNAVNWRNRWEKTCEKYDSIIILQPIIGSGNKTLVGDERDIVSYFRYKHTLNVYGELAREFEKMKCQKVDLRNVFDDEDEQIFWNISHVSDHGNQIIANKFYEISIQKILNKDAL